MTEKRITSFVYESSRHKILMDEYSKLSTDTQYLEWGKKAQAVAAYMSDAISKVNMAIGLEKNRLERESDRGKKTKIKMSLMQYESFSQILRTQLDKLIKLMAALPTGPVKPVTPELDKSKTLTPDSPYVKVFVGKSGEVSLDGRLTDIDDLKNGLMALAQRNGIVLYSREAPEDAEPPAIARTVINLVIENRLSIKMCKTDFSDALDSNGKLRI